MSKDDADLRIIQSKHDVPMLFEDGLVGIEWFYQSPALNPAFATYDGKTKVLTKFVDQVDLNDHLLEAFLSPRAQGDFSNSDATQILESDSVIMFEFQSEDHARENQILVMTNPLTKIALEKTNRFFAKLCHADDAFDDYPSVPSKRLCRYFGVEHKGVIPVSVGISQISRLIDDAKDWDQFFEIYATGFSSLPESIQNVLSDVYGKQSSKDALMKMIHALVEMPSELQQQVDSYIVKLEDLWNSMALLPDRVTHRGRTFYIPLPSNRPASEMESVIIGLEYSIFSNEHDNAYRTLSNVIDNLLFSLTSKREAGSDIEDLEKTARELFWDAESQLMTSVGYESIKPRSQEDFTKIRAAQVLHSLRPDLFKKPDFPGRVDGLGL